MAKFSGKIGYIITSDDNHGVWKESTEEKHHYGDILKDSFNIRNNENTSSNDDISISNRISILATPFSMENFQYMKYAIIMGTKWKILSVEIKYPRLILTLGGIYND